MHHLPREAIGALKQAARLLEIPNRQGAADPAATHPLGAIPKHRQHLHRQTMALAQGDQGCRIPAAALAKAKVFPHGHHSCSQLAHQHLLHKGLWRERRQGRIKGHQHQLLDAHRFEQFELFSW